jgi:hypothetical protein
MMKKFLLFALIIISVLLVVACKSSPASPAPVEAAPAPVETAPFEITEVNDAAFEAIYSRWFGDIILDGATTYTVVSGDYLAAISRRFYHDGYYYPLIMLASSDIVLDPDDIDIGMELTIPDLELNKANPRSREAIRGVILDCAVLEDLRGREGTARGLREHAEAL